MEAPKDVNGGNGAVSEFHSVYYRPGHEEARGDVVQSGRRENGSLD
ncbi:MAG: hypothetical protein ABI693_21050 [Bryobacteraceae bacterium]